MPWQPVFDGIIFCKQFLKRTTQGTVSEEKNFEEFL